MCNSPIFLQDLYVLAALIFLALNATQNAAVKYLASIYPVSEVTLYDRYSIIGLFIIFLFFHIIFGIYIIVTVSKRSFITGEKKGSVSIKYELGTSLKNMEMPLRKTDLPWLRVKMYFKYKMNGGISHLLHSIGLFSFASNDLL